MIRTRAQIVATIGPISGTEEMLGKLIDAGMDIMRLNFSHGTYDEHGSYIDNLRKAAQSRGVKVPILQDLSGPRGKTDDGHAFDSQQAEITEKDLRDLEFGISKNVDYIVQSYVGKAADVLAMRAEIEKRGAHIPIVGKIERQVGVDNAEEIIAASDAIMIGRGDLGEEVPIERLPYIQKELISKCNRMGKCVITATQMMLSMLESPTPTRAEVTDIAYAILCGSDAIMLSEETARGKYPLEAVTYMEKIAREAELHSEARRWVTL